MSCVTGVAVSVFRRCALAAGLVFAAASHCAHAEDTVMERDPWRRLCEACGLNSDTERPGLNLKLDMASKYVSRGVCISDRPVFQPCAGLTLDGFEASAWGSLDTTAANGRRHSFQELDYTLGYSRQLKDVPGVKSLTLSAGHIWYVFPAQNPGRTRELYAGAQMEDVPLKPSVTAYHDYVQADGVYVSPTLEHTFCVCRDVLHLTLKGGVGWSDGGMNRFNIGVERNVAGFVDATLSATLTWKLTELLSISGTIAGSQLVDRRLREFAKEDGANAGFVWGGLGFNVAF